MILQRYLQKNSLYNKLISKSPSDALSLVIVIPSYGEKQLDITLQSILACKNNNEGVEVIVVLNEAEENMELNSFHQRQMEEIHSKFNNANLPIHVIHVQFPKKHAGVGSARKVGMDEAVLRFQAAGNNKGIIVCLDADCIVSEDYLTEIFDYFLQAESKDAVSIGFCHRYDGLEPEEKQAAILYELHLRYFIRVQKEALYPFAFQTIGSSMAVRADGYCMQGGMNRRQAGEDFYFLHKFSVIKQLGEIKKVLVFPSGRRSNRVPFGTGKAVIQILQHHGLCETYDFNSIVLFCKQLPKAGAWYDSSLEEILSQIKSENETLYDFLVSADISSWVRDAFQNSSSKDAFIQRIQKQFHPFQLMKWLHFAESRQFPRRNLLTMVDDYAKTDKNFRASEALKAEEWLYNFAIKDQS